MTTKVVLSWLHLRFTIDDLRFTSQSYWSSVPFQVGNGMQHGGKLSCLHKFPPTLKLSSSLPFKNEQNRWSSQLLLPQGYQLMESMADTSIFYHSKSSASTFQLGLYLWEGKCCHLAPQFVRGQGLASEQEVRMDSFSWVFLHANSFFY